MFFARGSSLILSDPVDGRFKVLIAPELLQESSVFGLASYDLVTDVLGEGSVVEGLFFFSSNTLDLADDLVTDVGVNVVVQETTGVLIAIIILRVIKHKMVGVMEVVSPAGSGELLCLVWCKGRAVFLLRLLDGLCGVEFRKVRDIRQLFMLVGAETLVVDVAVLVEIDVLRYHFAWYKGNNL
jgi:hypothetical protein